MKNLFYYVLAAILIVLAIIPLGFSYAYYPSTYGYYGYTTTTYTTNTYVAQTYPTYYYPTYVAPAAYYVPVVNYSPVYTFPYSYYVNGVPVTYAYGTYGYPAYNYAYSYTTYYVS
ncbi:MAG: hypothetical protein COT55_02295 [Candidatus Diapherotrites archaeon CG09_land_8_20_14_0_10_32_12]|nr:MAG: hypothetical protein COT55_02295 [Candidatus Diapherotrites archaeon CG09_land_8_20_14_0_10_32_12]